MKTQGRHVHTTHTRAHTHTCTRTCTHMYTYAHTHVRTHAHTHAHTDTHTYTHMHTHALRASVAGLSPHVQLDTTGPLVTEQEKMDKKQALHFNNSTALLSFSKAVSVLRKLHH